MDEFFDLVANILNQGNPEQALTLLSQVTDSSERYNTLLQQARETLSQKLMKQIQQAIAANTPDQARALIAEYRSKLGPNPTIDILETTLASAPVAPQAVPSTPPVSSEPPLVIPQPVQQVAPQPMPQSVPPVSSEPPVVKPQPIPASGPISSSSETKVFSSQPQPVAQPEPQAYTPSQSYMPASTPPAKKSKRWLIWLIAVLVLLGAMAASYFFITPVKDFVNKTFGIGSSTTTSMADENDDEAFFDDENAEGDDFGDEDDEWGEDDWADDDSSSEETTDEEDLSSNEEEAEPVKPQKDNQVQNNTAQNTNQNKPDRTNNTNTTQTVVEDNKVYTNVEPSYPGGPAKLVQYLNNSKHKKVGSAHVNVSFVVEKDGSVREASIMSSNNSSANEEALRVVRSLRMNPATVYGKPVRSKYSVSVDW